MTIKGFHKLITQPHLFSRDYVKKKFRDDQLRKYVSTAIDLEIPFHNYYYFLFQELNKEKFFSKATVALNKAIKYKAKPIYYYELGIVLTKSKKNWQSVDAFNEAIVLGEPIVNTEWYKKYAIALTQMARHKDASLAWESALKDESENSDDWFKYGYSLELSNNVEKAKTIYKKAIALDKNKNAKELGVGIFHEKRGYWQEASEAYRITVNKNPLNADLRYRYALALDRSYNWIEAEKEYLIAINLKPEHIDWYYRLGFVRERQEKYEKAAESYMYAAQNRKSHTPYWYYRLASVLEKAGFHKESNEAFLMMKKIKVPKSKNITVPFMNKDKYFYELGIELKKKKQWWQAGDALERAINLSNGNIPTLWHREYAFVLTQMARHKDASLAWESALKDESENSDDWFKYGYSLELSNNVEKAKTIYKKAIALDKNKNAKELGVGIFHEKRGYWSNAIDSYKEKLDKELYNTSLRYKYALALDRCYEWEKAEEQYLLAIAIRPENADYYYRLGFVLERQGKYEKAIEAYTYAIKNKEVHTPYYYYRLASVFEKVGFYKESNEAFLMMKKIKLNDVDTIDNKLCYDEVFLLENYYKHINLFLNNKTIRNDIWKKLIEKESNE